MQTVVRKINTYKFNELPKNIQSDAIDYFREDNLDYEWWDCVYEDFETICSIMGVKTAYKKIYFSGFSSQGDGACFEGTYSYKRGSVKAIKEFAPLDKTLHDIALNLAKLQRKSFYRLEASIKQSGHYYHCYCTNIEVSLNRENESRDYLSVTAEQENGITEYLRDLMKWLYKTLENEYNYLQSDEAIKETIEANDYDFTENGRLF